MYRNYFCDGKDQSVMALCELWAIGRSLAYQ